MQVLPAELSDAEELLVLQKLAYLSEAETYGDYSIQPLTQTVEEVREEIDRHIALKAVEGVGMVGSVRAKQSNGTCSIGKLIVHPGWQGRGIGKELMREVESCFPDASKFSLFTGHLSEKNLRLYEKLGYSESGREMVSDSLTLVHMEKPQRFRNP